MWYDNYSEIDEIESHQTAMEKAIKNEVKAAQSFWVRLGNLIPENGSRAWERMIREYQFWAYNEFEKR